MGWLPFKRDLLIHIAGAERPKKYKWQEFGAYLAKEAFLASQEDIRAMKTGRRTEVLPKFLNNPIGVRMLSTAFYLWSNYKAISPILRKGEEDKNREALFMGFEDGLKQLTPPNSKKPIFNKKHIEFIIRYYKFLINQTGEKQFDPGATYAQSMYKFYKLPVGNDPILLQEKGDKAQYMMKRLTETNARLNRKLTIRTL